MDDYSIKTNLSIEECNRRTLDTTLAKINTKPAHPTTHPCPFCGSTMVWEDAPPDRPAADGVWLCQGKCTDGFPG